ncbi:hypothetical protein V8C37DRAFT_413165 [Trichoderma ceciliae]
MAHNRGISLTQIHPSPDAGAETDIDIIAIHGLDTKSPDTWIWKSKHPDGDVNWLACPRMLPGIIGPARIFMCDWPANLFEQSDLIQKTPEDFARRLLAGINQRPLPKTTKGKDRPIVFIASCLGGIMLMKALLTADHPPSEYTVIRQATRGIIFLATPFRGTSFQDVANWAEPGLRAWALVRGQEVSKLIDSVKGSTFHLEELVRRFTQLCRDKDFPYHVLTFYELGKTSLHRKFPLSWLIPSWLLNQYCPPKQLVDSSSATLDIVPNPLPLDRPHVMMNKFSGPEDPDYKCVAGKIEEILLDIRTNSLLDVADAWIHDHHYTADRLKIERLSGELLSMDQCYINLAIVEQSNQGEGRLKEGDVTPSPFSLFHRQKVTTPDKTIQVELATIFDHRKGRDGDTIQPRRILIRGRAGVGKTTLCKKIVHEFTQGTWSKWNDLFDRVLWVPLRNLKLEERRRQPAYDFACLFTHEYFSLPNNKPHLARELARALETNSSKTLFLLDGLDEVSQNLISNDSMSSFLNELLKQPNIIVTSRPSGKLPLDPDLILETIGFYPDQVKDYIKKTFTNRQTVDKVQSFLQDHWLIQGLVRIPIQLDALCYSWKDIHNDMPETMTALYQAIELSLWKKEILRLKKTHGQDPVTLDDIQGASRQKIEGFVRDEIYFLESLAFTGPYNDVIEFELKHLNDISDPFLKLLPDKIAPCLSFLRTSNPSSEDRNRSYHFIHLTFQEYFAARYFVRQWVARDSLKCVELDRRKTEIEPVKFFLKHKYTARYDILWRFVAGLLDAGREETPGFSQKVEEFFQNIDEEPLDLLGPTHQRLVMHCLSEVSSDLQVRTNLEQQLSKWLIFECEFGQSDRAYLASEVEFPEQALNTAFDEGSDDIKRKILRSLTKRATIPASIIEQVASWLEDDNEYIQQAAIAALGQQSALPNEILKAIAARLEDKSEAIREAAIEVLRRQSALPTCNEILKAIAARLEDESEAVRQAAIKVLRQQSALPNEILKAIVARLEHKDWAVRQAAIEALYWQSALPTCNEILKAIAARLEDKSEAVRQAAIMALGQQSALPNKILEAIAARLEHKDCAVREAAIEASGQQPALPNEILKAIAAQLEHKDRAVRKAAIMALGQQSALPNEILKAIVARLEHKDQAIRETAIEALRWQSALPKEILEAIAARLEDKNKVIREAAETILRRHREFYCTLLNGPDVTSLYKVLLKRSFEEQLSWYIDDGNSCINMLEGTCIGTSIDNHNDVKAKIENARPTNFPVGRAQDN